MFDVILTDNFQYYDKFVDAENISQSESKEKCRVPISQNTVQHE